MLQDKEPKVPSDGIEAPRGSISRRYLCMGLLSDVRYPGKNVDSEVELVPPKHRKRKLLYYSVSDLHFLERMILTFHPLDCVDSH